MSKRKWVVMTAIASLMVCPFIRAQNNLMLGWKAGGNLAWNYGNSIKATFDSDAKMIEKQFGWSLGVFAIKPCFNKDAIQAELMVSQQGTKSLEAENHYQTWKLTYISVPVLFQKTMRQKEGGCRSYLFAGPVAGFLINSQYINEIGGLVEKNDIEDTNILDLGIALGIGRISSEGITLDLRYQLGLLNVAEGDAKNDVLAFHLGFLIR